MREEKGNEDEILKGLIAQLVVLLIFYLILGALLWILSDSILVLLIGIGASMFMIFYIEIISYLEMYKGEK